MTSRSDSALIAYYKLDGHTPVPCDLMEWARFFEKPANRIVKQETVGDARVSTVFLGLDHRMIDGNEPILFETMIFGGPYDQHQDRCSTWEQAEAMHAKAVALVKGGR